MPSASAKNIVNRAFIRYGQAKTGGELVVPVVEQCNTVDIVETTVLYVWSL